MRQGRHVIVGLVLVVLGCTPGYRPPQTAPQTWRGDKTGHVYQEVGGGLVEDAPTGVLYPRVDQVWIRGEQGHLMYLYEGLVEEPQQWGSEGSMLWRFGRTMKLAPCSVPTVASRCNAP